MKTVIFMPIKMNNERTPGKNTKLFEDGTPLLQVPLKTALKVKNEGIVDDVIVFCSNPDIQKYLLDGVTYLERNKELDSQAIRCGDIIKGFLDVVEADIYVMYHATSPFISENTLINCLNAVKSGEYDSAFAAKKLQNFMWYRNEPLNFSLDCAPRTQDMEPYFCEISSPYVFTRNVFEQYHGRTGKRPYIQECSEIEAIDIDYPEDFELANVVYMNLLKRKI